MAPMNEILLYGTVGQTFWDDDYFTASTVRQQLAGLTGDITVRINSGGGVATEGQAIYTMLVDHPGKVTVIVDSVAASAASLIAMAGDEIVMRRGAWMLIHDPANPYTEGRGTEEEHRKTAERLNVVGRAYADIYAARTGLSPEAARRVMREETVLDGQAAVDMGFATRTDDEQAIAAAAFDYRIYANAPAALRLASRYPGPVPGQTAVMAMFAGLPRNPKEKEPPMADVQNPAVEVAPVAAAPQPAASPVPQTDPTPAAPVDVAQVTVAERTRVKSILDAAQMGGVPSDFARDLVDRGVSLDQALVQITAKWKEGGDVNIPRAGRPTTQILRDERDTMRQGMVMALTAQMAGTAPASDIARPYMALSMVDMAAQAIDYRGSTRTAFDRQSVIEAAFHTTSDFPAIFENSLTKRLLASYELTTPVYQRIAMRADFSDFRPHPMANTGSFPLLLPVAESGEITYGTLGEKKETVALVAYARAMRITRQMIINDDLGAIDRIVRNQGLSVARTEEAVFFAMFLGGANADGPTLTETGRQVFSTNAADLTKAGTGTAISITSIGAGRAAILKQKGIDSEDLALTPSIILTGPDYQTDAEKLVADISPVASGEVNPFSGRLTPISTPKITGNAWYLMADPAVQAAFMYGYLQGDAGPRMRMDEPFGVQGVAYSIERDFGCGAIDKRGVWKNAGA
jgi:ATP-dependent protease ClpP protease subunit